MYKLHYFPGNANIAPHIALAALEVPYELALVNRKDEEQRSPAYRAMNPTGRIPTLVDDGRVVFETGAILLYLAEKHPEAGLAPLPGDAARGEFLTWLVHLANTVQPAFRTFFYPEEAVDDPAGVADAKAVAERRLGAMFDLLEARLEGRGWLAGDRMSVADLLLFMLIRWGRFLQRPPRALPNLARLAAAVAALPATARAMAEEGLAAPWY